MKYSPRQVVLNSELFQNLKKPIVVIDGGSRGDIFHPFGLVEGGLEVYAFEPDADGILERKEKGNTTHFLNKGLWMDDSEVELHLARNPSTSSVYPPNMEFLAHFPPHLGTRGRATEKVLRIDSTSIDLAVERGQCLPPHFIKLDIHSSEYEALRGARACLQNSVVGVLVETWHSPVHRGQKLHGEIEAFLNEQGYFMFHFREASRWKYHESTGGGIEVDAARLIGSESLFFRDFLSGDGKVEPDLAMIAVGLADLFGFSRYAALLADHFGRQGVLSPDAQKSLERLLVEKNRFFPALLTGAFWREYLRNVARSVLGKP